MSTTFQLSGRIPPFDRSAQIGLGTVTVLAKISAHSEQIFGLAWSPDNMYFVTGGNDNVALLFEISKILRTNSERGRTRYRAQAEHHEEVIITTPHRRPSNTDLVRGWSRFSECEAQFGDSGITTPRRHPHPTVSLGFCVSLRNA
jgi:WD40 repeat protein